MRYIALVACFVVLIISSSAVSHAQTEPAPTDAPTAAAAEVSTESPTAVATEGPTATPTPDFYKIYDLGNGKSGAIVYTVTGGDIALISLGVVAFICVLFLVYLELKESKP